MNELDKYYLIGIILCAMSLVLILLGTILNVGEVISLGIVTWIIGNIITISSLIMMVRGIGS